MTSASDLTAEVEAATKRIEELSAQVVQQAKANGLAWLEGYERVLRNLLEFEETAAKGSQAEWVASLATTHANFVRETSQVFFGALREQLKS